MSSPRKVMFKIVTVGDAKVGKTSVMTQYCQHKFDAKYKPTIGADFLTREILVDGRTVTLQIWDTAGQERFQSLGTAFYRGADVCVAMFDVTRQASFDLVPKFLEEFFLHAQPTNRSSFPLFLVGNKCDDAEHREVSAEAMQEFAQAQSDPPMIALETSAKDSDGIDELFVRAARAALENSVQWEEKTTLQRPAEGSPKSGFFAKCFSGCKK